MNRLSHSLFGRRAVAMGLVTASLCTPVRADELRSISLGVRLALGSRTRIVLLERNTPPLVGMVRAMDKASITIETSGGATIRAPRDEIRSLQISVDRKRNTLKGALIGASVSAALGAVLGAAACDVPSSSNSSRVASPDCSRAEGAAVLGAFFIPGGAFWGGVLGHRSQADHWADVPLLRASLDVSAAGAGATTEAQVAPGRSTSGSRLLVGSRVRVIHAGQKTEGTLMDISPATVTLGASVGTLSIPREAVEGIETWGGEKKRPLKGAIIGLVSGFALDFTSAPYCTLGGQVDTSCSRLASASETAIGGAAIGAVIGLLVKKTTWIPMRLSGPEVAPAKPSAAAAVELSPIVPRGGHGAGLRLRLVW
ncbi:MAG: hypothetical protein ABI565_05015 [Vicinamibacteria bacterium]